MTDAKRPLNGIRVIDLGPHQAGCGFHLFVRSAYAARRRYS